MTADAGSLGATAAPKMRNTKNSGGTFEERLDPALLETFQAAPEIDLAQAEFLASAHPEARAFAAVVAT